MNATSSIEACTNEHSIERTTDSVPMLRKRRRCGSGLSDARSVPLNPPCAIAVPESNSNSETKSNSRLLSHNVVSDCEEHDDSSSSVLSSSFSSSHSQTNQTRTNKGALPPTSCLLPQTPAIPDSMGCIRTITTEEEVGAPAWKQIIRKRPRKRIRLQLQPGEFLEATSATACPISLINGCAKASVQLAHQSIVKIIYGPHQGIVGVIQKVRQHEILVRLPAFSFHMDRWFERQHVKLVPETDILSCLNSAASGPAQQKAAPTNTAMTAATEQEGDTTSMEESAAAKEDLSGMEIAHQQPDASGLFDSSTSLTGSHGHTASLSESDETHSFFPLESTEEQLQLADKLAAITAEYVEAKEEVLELHDKVTGFQLEELKSQCAAYALRVKVQSLQNQTIPTLKQENEKMRHYCESLEEKARKTDEKEGDRVECKTETLVQHIITQKALTAVALPADGAGSITKKRTKKSFSSYKDLRPSPLITNDLEFYEKNDARDDLADIELLESFRTPNSFIKNQETYVRMDLAIDPIPVNDERPTREGNSSPTVDGDVVEEDKAFFEGFIDAMFDTEQGIDSTTTTDDLTSNGDRIARDDSAIQGRLSDLSILEAAKLDPSDYIEGAL